MASKTEMTTRRFEVYVLPPPAAGVSNEEFTIPFTRGRLIVGQNIMTASAVAANRRFALVQRVRATGDTMLTMPSATTQTANQVITYNLMAGGESYVDSIGTNVQIPLPCNGLLVSRFDTVRVSVANMDGGDQLGVTSLLFEIDET